MTENIRFMYICLISLGGAIVAMKRHIGIVQLLEHDSGLANLGVSLVLKAHLSHEQKPGVPYFPLNPGWLMGILIMVYEIILI